MSRELLYDHYKETCAKSEEAQTYRNKFFLSSLVCIVGLTLFLMLPDILVQAILSWLQVNISADMNSLIALFQSLVWAFLVYVLIRYIQASVRVERSYPYIHKLEKELGLTRESNDYSSDYPIILDFIDFFYKKFYPSALIVFTTTKTILEWVSSKCNVIYLIIDSVFALLIIILMVLYRAFLYKVARHYKTGLNTGA